jgi:hypothetical protein
MPGKRMPLEWKIYGEKRENTKSSPRVEMMEQKTTKRLKKLKGVDPQ